jgi:hypothetical protein
LALIARASAIASRKSLIVTLLAPHLATQPESLGPEETLLGIEPDDLFGRQRIRDRPGERLRLG